jgi:hypothetical protein
MVEISYKNFMSHCLPAIRRGEKIAMLSRRRQPYSLMLE